MPRVNSKVYIVHTLDNDTDALDKEYEDVIEGWLSYCPIDKIQIITGTPKNIECYLKEELEKLGYKVIKDKSE